MDHVRDRDREEVRAVRGAGGVEAVARLLDRYRARLRRGVELRMDPRMRARVDASDIIQETLIEAANRVDDYIDTPGESLYVWLRMLARQKLLQLRRHHVETQKRAAGRDVPIDPLVFGRSSTCQLADRLLASTTSPSSFAGRRERRAALLEALAGLEELDQEILILRCLEELSNAETAKVLQINESTTSTRFLRALKRLRAALEATSGAVE